MKAIPTEQGRHHHPLPLLFYPFSLFAALMLCAAPAQAAMLDEIKAGILYHDTGFWGGSGNEEGIDANVELIFSPSVMLLSGQLRPNIGISLNDRGDTSKLYGGGVWEYEGRSGWFFGFGLGLAVHNGEIDDNAVDDRSLLGSSLLFRLAFETGLNLTPHHRLSLMYDHISNAYLADPNEGLDSFGVRYGYRF